ncbi:MAG TPA: IS200/IS605 family transposase [Ignavibacteria bacterium]|nr:IS200/IS605 family transposase [Ignavibacteria bacterium]
MSYVRIWVHIVFATKYRQPLMSDNIRYEIQKHIMKNCAEKNIFLQSINGYTEHLHCLISLGKEQTISYVAQMIKGESSFWINNNNLTHDKFSWQDDYYAVSVSQSHVKRVINYIKNQEAHHSRKTFKDEIDEFVNRYGWKILNDKK